MLIKPMEIEMRSMEIIESEMPATSYSPDELLVVKRCIHTSADFEYATQMHFSKGVVEHAKNSIKKGLTIVTDTNMALSGVNKAALEASGCQVRCFMAEEEVAKEAKERGVTRAIISMEHAAKIQGPIAFAIGNAPTALIQLDQMIKENVIKPEFIIAAPVGFVNVVESKELIMDTEIPCIVAKGRKGGSNIAAAICNALWYQVVER